MQNFVNTQKELIYTSKHREPLGRSIERNYIFPSSVKENEFKGFGYKSNGSGINWKLKTFIDFPLKNLLYNTVHLNEKEEDKKRYLKTHGICEPGYQKQRDYNWPVDKTNFVFGKGEKKEWGGTEKSLKTDFLLAAYPKTKIVEKRYNDFSQASQELIGIPKFRGTLHSSIDSDYVFGQVKKKQGFISNAANCLTGDTSVIKPEDYHPDADLSKNVRFKSKLAKIIPSEKDQTKVFGLPSIRSDLTSQFLPSIANLINFGTDPDAYELLYPNANAARGLEGKDFEKLLNKEEVFYYIKI